MNFFISYFYFLFIPLVITICVESFVFWFFQLFLFDCRFRYFFFSIIAVNLATNPLFNFFSFLLDPLRMLFLMEIAFEVLIVLVEWGIFCFIYKKDFLKLFLLSFLLNFFSYVVGLVIFSPSWI